MIEASEYIDEIVTLMDSTILGKYDYTNSRTYFCDTKWARVGKLITDSNHNIFRITEVVTDTYIVAKHNSDPSYILDGLCELENPFFMTGTKLATNREWTLADSNLENKLPLIWLLEIIKETGYGKGSSFERDIEAKVFFLDETDPSQYYTKQNREQVVKPMQKLMNEFIKTVDKIREYKTLESYKYKTFSRFGVEQDNGVFQNILDANLSGVALEITLTRYKENCKC
tara:strand:+ start:9708 stop:10391 length:684 start_codon:yes stop_codon:yes gene_type:complete